jgi:predicted DNA-binding WGR domain protein
MPTHILVNGLGLTYKTTMGISMATIPDVCKTPSPGGPIPIPYPNIARQSSLKGGTTTVKAKNNMIANKGSQYGSSNGDEAGTAGGVKSGVNMKATDWITYSFDVKMDGKNACRHTDKKFHNNQNAADLAGDIDPVTGKPWHKCGEVGKYGSQCNSGKAAKPEFERDHVPAKAQLKARARRKKGYQNATDKQQECIESAVEYRGLSIVIPKSAHRGHSVTCGNRNNAAQINADSASKESMDAAADRDTKAMQAHLDQVAANGTQEDKDCAAAYREATKTIKANDPDKMIDEAIADCKAKHP